MVRSGEQDPRDVITAGVDGDVETKAVAKTTPARSRKLESPEKSPAHSTEQCKKTIIKFSILFTGTLGVSKGVLTLVTASTFSVVERNFLTMQRMVWTIFDTHQLGVRLNKFDVDVKILLSRSYL